MTGSFLLPCRGRHLFVYNSFTSVTHYSRAAIRISIQKAAGTKSPQYPVENAAANCADCRLFCAPRAAYNSTSSKGCKCMRNWCSRHPVWFMALYALFYLSFFALLERTIQTPDLWVHCRLDDLIPFCKYAIVPYICGFRGSRLRCFTCCIRPAGGFLAAVHSAVHRHDDDASVLCHCA